MYELTVGRDSHHHGAELESDERLVLNVALKLLERAGRQDEPRDRERTEAVIANIRTKLNI